MTWDDLTIGFKSYRELQCQYYAARFRYFKLLAKAKREATRQDNISWKDFERRCRAATKRWRRQQKRPRGKVCDHIVSVFKAYCIGWSIEQACHPSNLQWLSKKDNLDKGPI